MSSAYTIFFPSTLGFLLSRVLLFFLSLTSVFLFILLPHFLSSLSIIRDPHLRHPLALFDSSFLGNFIIFSFLIILVSPYSFNWCCSLFVYSINFFFTSSFGPSKSFSLIRSCSLFSHRPFFPSQRWTCIPFSTSPRASSPQPSVKTTRGASSDSICSVTPASSVEANVGTQTSEDNVFSSSSFFLFSYFFLFSFFRFTQYLPFLFFLVSDFCASCFPISLSYFLSLSC